MKTFFKRAKKVIHKKRQPITATITLAMVLVSYQNCQQQEFYAKDNLSEIARDDISSNTEGTTVVDNGQPTPPTPPVPPTPTPSPLCQNGQSTSELICNPLNPIDPVNPPITGGDRIGLIAKLYEGNYNWNFLDDYFVKGYKHPENIYFSNFNIPTRSFNEGFALSNNVFLKNKNGDKLIEWFAIEANGQISLPEDEEEGEYHIMTLSDDGIEVVIGSDALIQNKSTHAPTFNCAKKFVTFKKGEEHDFRLRYFQGPRYHIALMTFIKKVDAGISSATCPKVSNVGELLNKGYEVIKPEWFTLPKDF